MTSRPSSIWFSFTLLCTILPTAVAAFEQTDVLIYGATPAGISAAIAAATEGHEVLLVEPTNRIGGLVTSGLSHTDYHSRESLSGAFLDFALRVQKHYETTYGPDSQQLKDCEGGVFAEPKVNLAVFEQMLAEWPKIRVLHQHILKSVEMNSAGSRIQSVTFTDANGAEAHDQR
jgi:2-polyprenyl-6-methoxyphenol hydroxylase-like FAD-dependent oxidoreductase